MNRQKYHLFSELLEYPGPRLNERLKECLDLLTEANQEVATRLKRFLDLTEEMPAGRLEEVYSGTFDLQVVCYPYVGYQLFGESYKRGAFMVALKERYRDPAIWEGNELPGNLTLVLRFLAETGDDAEREEFARECLIPSLDKMERGFRDKDNPYLEVIAALSLLLREEYPGAMPALASPAADPLSHDLIQQEGNGGCASCFSPSVASEER